MWRIIFYVALLRTQHWLHSNGQALQASLPWVMREQVPKWEKTIQEAQELIQQMRPLSETWQARTRETRIAMSESIETLLQPIGTEQTLRFRAQPSVACGHLQ